MQYDKLVSILNNSFFAYYGCCHPCSCDNLNRHFLKINLSKYLFVTKCHHSEYINAIFLSLFNKLIFQYLFEVVFIIKSILKDRPEN